MAVFGRGIVNGAVCAARVVVTDPRAITDETDTTTVAVHGATAHGEAHSSAPKVETAVTGATGGNAAQPTEKMPREKAEKMAEKTVEPETAKLDVAKTEPTLPAAPKPEAVKTAAAKLKADDAIALPDGWATWTPEERNAWIKPQTHLAPSQKVKLLMDARAADEAREAAKPPKVESVIEKTDAETAGYDEAQREAERAEADANVGLEPETPNASSVELPNWEKWSLAKRIVWVTSLNAADTGRVVGLLEFRKEVGDVSEDNLQVARRKLQIAMRMRDQVENGQKAK